MTKMERRQKREVEDTIFEGPVSFLQLPGKNLGIIKLGDATPYVTNSEVWEFANTSPVTVTNFLGGQPGQIISLLGDGQTTIQHNANIKTNTGADKLLLADKVYRFILYSSFWVEDA